MRYSIILLSLVVVCLSLNLVSADAESDAVDKAYQCIESKLTSRSSSSLALQEALFGALAIGSNTNALARIDAEKNTIGDQTCWPSSGCKVKDTAQMLLAYEEIGRSTDSLESYLLSKSASATGLRWFLVVDIENQEAATCTVRYGGQSRSLNVGEDMRITGDAGSCLTSAGDGYWLEIAPNCLERSFEVSCNKDFITSLHYRKNNNDETLYLSPNTHSAIGSGTTNESIQSKCFKQGAECDYESTLWATLALQVADREVAAYIPYLRALASDNKKYFPEAFLLKLTDNQEDFSTLIQGQVQERYWQAPTTPYNRLYDTSLALLALQARSSEQTVTNAKSYLLSIQGTNGCWNDNIRDTSFLLYAGWPRGGSSGGSGNSSGSSSGQCQQAGLPYACVNSYTTCLEGGGTILNNYQCPGIAFCCSQAPIQQTCTELNGILCGTTETCTGSLVESAEGSCCLDACVPEVFPEADACTQSSGVCSSSCDADSEEQTLDLCTDVSQVCCVEKSTSSSSSSSWIWITFLVLLIALVVLAIIYRKRLQLWLHRTKKPKSSTAPVIVRRPPFPPSGPMRRPEFPATRSAPARQPSHIDKEMEETLKKLKEMSR